ncbi:hypothetical protein [Streptosporangium sp. NPDC020145]
MTLDVRTVLPIAEQAVTIAATPAFLTGLLDLITETDKNAPHPVQPR